MHYLAKDHINHNGTTYRVGDRVSISGLKVKIRSFCTISPDHNELFIATDYGDFNLDVVDCPADPPQSEEIS